MKRGRAPRGALCGLGARDLCVLEATFPLMVGDDETITPLERGREDLVDWEKADLLVKPLLLRKKKVLKRDWRGLEILGRRIPRYITPSTLKKGCPAVM